MRILHVVGDSKFGGASRMVIALADHAKKRGWQTDVVTTDGPFQEALAQADIRAIPLDVARRALNPFVDIRGLARLTSFLRCNQYDVVHTHTSKGGFIGRLAATMAGVPAVVHTAHGFAIHEQSPLRHQVPYAVLEALAAYCCHRVICVSEFHRDWGIRLGIGNAVKTIAIVNGIPSSRVMPLRARTATRCSVGVGDDVLMVLTPGRLFQQKGLETLLHAIAGLPEDHRQRTRFVLAGDGPLRETLERMVSDLHLKQSVVLTGFREDVGDLLYAADVVVLPSVREGLSIALLESIAAAKPIIATTIGSNREVAAKKDCMVLVSPDSETDLREAISRVCADGTLRSRMSSLALSTYQEFYTEDRMLAAYSELYESLLKPNSGIAKAAKAA